jgi:four helix bundle protein
MNPPVKFDSQKFYERLFEFGLKCQRLMLELPKTDYNRIYSNQLIRSSSSPGANYIEALEAVGKKDFVHRLRICRKEARESVNWLRYIKETNKETQSIGESAELLITEGRELVRVLSSSILTLEKSSH